MAMDAGEVERLIKAKLPDAKVTIRDLVGDGDHLSARVVSQAFRGKTARPAASDGLRGTRGSHGRDSACACTRDVCACG